MLALSRRGAIVVNAPRSHLLRRAKQKRAVTGWVSEEDSTMQRRNDFAPQEILFGALRVLYVASVASRNLTLHRPVPRKQLNALWEALHVAPDLLTRWRADAEEELLRYLDEYDEAFDDLQLRATYERARDGAHPGTRS
jgi:hypothetical protein